MQHNITNCPLQQAMKVIGGKWKLVIIWQLLSRPHRFNELKRLIGSISTKVLSDQLSQLEQHGLISRHTLPTNPPQVEYRITDLGTTLAPSLQSLHNWGSGLHLNTDTTTEN